MKAAFSGSPGFKRGAFLLLLLLSGSLPVFSTDYQSVFDVWKTLPEVPQMEDPRELVFLGFACWKYSLFLEAETVFKRMIELNPEAPDGYLWLFRTFQFEGAAKTVWASRAKSDFEKLFPRAFPSLASSFRSIPEKNRLSEAGKFLLQEMNKEPSQEGE